MYNPSVGRFTSEDPRGFAAGDENLFRYVRNGPNNATDPSGTFEFRPLKQDGTFGNSIWIAPGPTQKTIPVSLAKNDMATLEVAKDGKIWYSNPKTQLQPDLTGGLTISVTGTAAWVKDVRFIQFLRLEATRFTVYQEKWIEKCDYPFTHKHEGQHEIESSTANNPKWTIDTYSKSQPYYTSPGEKIGSDKSLTAGYGGTIVEGPGNVLSSSTSWMFDRPTTAEFEAFRIAKTLQKPSDTIYRDSVTVKAVFHTYAVYGSKFIGHVEWTSVSRAWPNENGKIIMIPSVITIRDVDTEQPTNAMLTVLEKEYSKNWHMR